MEKKKLLIKIRKELRNKADKIYKQGAENFFKESIKIYGVRAPELRCIARKFFPKSIEKEELFNLCEELLKSGYGEEAHIAFGWAYHLKKDYKVSDFLVFEKWLKRYVSDWGMCDDFCGHNLGYLIFSFPQLLPRVKRWTKSKNRWLRRASAVSLIYSVRKRRYLKEIFKTAKILLEDTDDLVQKGYGWMLKEASNVYQREIFDFVMAHKRKMPRTALRYAIEKMPLNLKKKAMSK